MGRARITIEVDEERLAAIERAVAAGRVPSVHAFLEHAAALALDDARDDAAPEEPQAARPRRPQ